MKNKIIFSSTLILLGAAHAQTAGTVKNDPLKGLQNEVSKTIKDITKSDNKSDNEARKRKSLEILRDGEKTINDFKKSEKESILKKADDESKTEQKNKLTEKKIKEIEINEKSQRQKPDLKAKDVAPISTPSGVAPLDAEGLANSLPTISFDPKSFGDAIDWNEIADAYNVDPKKKEKKNLYQIMAFVSLSMPKTSLIRMNRDLAKVNGLMVFRGLNGKISSEAWNKTMASLKEIGEQGADIQINPALFVKYKIVLAPTLIVSSEPDGDEGCSDLKCSGNVGRVIGDVTVDYSLGILQKTKGPVGELAIEKLKKFTFK